MSGTRDDMTSDARMAEEIAAAHRELRAGDEASLARVEASLAHRMASADAVMRRGRRDGGRFLLRGVVAALAVAAGVTLAVLDPNMPEQRDGLARAEVAERAAKAVDRVPGPGEVLYQRAVIEVSDTAGNRGTETVQVWQTWDGSRRRIEQVRRRTAGSGKFQLGMFAPEPDEDETVTVVRDVSGKEPFNWRMSLRHGVTTVGGNLGTSSVFYHPYLVAPCQKCHSTHPGSVTAAQSSVAPTATADAHRAHMLDLLNEGAVRFLGKRTVDGEQAYLFRSARIGGAKHEGGYEQAYVSAKDFRIVRYDRLGAEKRGKRSRMTIRFKERRVMPESALAARTFRPRLPYGPVFFRISMTAKGGGDFGGSWIPPTRIDMPPVPAYWFGLDAKALSTKNARLYAGNWQWTGRFVARSAEVLRDAQLPRSDDFACVSRPYRLLSVGAIALSYANQMWDPMAAAASVVTQRERPGVLDDRDWTFAPVMAAKRSSWYGYRTTRLGERPTDRTLVVQMPDGWVTVTGIEEGLDVRLVSDALIRTR